MPSRPKSRKPVISPRKAPQQARSTRMVADLLEAALRVLAREGAARFTTVRVAEEAGVSVGSLYQYFPSKEALLYRLQTDEWQATGALLEGLLADATRPPLERLRHTVRAFFRSECEEAELRVALGDAASLYRDAAAPEVRAGRARVMRRVVTFMKEALPGVSAKRRAVAAELVLTTMSTVGKRVSEGARTRAAVDTWAAATSDMLAAYLTQLAREHGGGDGAR